MAIFVKKKLYDETVAQLDQYRELYEGQLKHVRMLHREYHNQIVQLRRENAALQPVRQTLKPKSRPHS